MSKVELFRDTYISVAFDEELQCIYADWIGYQTLATVQEGCEQILEMMVLKGCQKILNDNTHVDGIWSKASEWVGSDWFPRLRQHGMIAFAWVYSPSAFSRLSADKSLRFTYDMNGIETFYEINEAEKWLAAYTK